jgi:signal transduction histidine kinase
MRVPPEHTVEERIVEALLLVFALNNLAYCIQDFVLGTNNTLVFWLSVLLTVGGFGLFYFVRYRKAYERVVKPVIGGLLVLHTVIFFQINGFRSALAMDFVNIGFATTFVLRGRTRKLFLAVFAANVITLLVVQVTLPKLPDVYDDNVVLDTFVHIALSLYIAYVIKRQYDIYQQDIIEKNLELLEKNNEILAQNEEIASMNEQLSHTLDQRSTQLQDKSQKISQYANLNSHGVRAPLARVMGLLELIRQEQPSVSPQTAEYLEKLRFSAHELDTIIRKINQTLEDETD